jgi:hypothetical protein
VNAHPSEKLCPRCGVLLRVLVGVTFNRKTDSADGLQPWCRRCDHLNKRNPDNGWRNFHRILPAHEAALWTETAYLAMMGDFRCHTCGANVCEWSGGYWVDRISNKRGYLAGNCRPCCWGCNRLKSNRNPESFEWDVRAYVERYGRGRVPWDQIQPGVEHTADNAPDLSEHAVPTKQIGLFSWGTP